MGLFTFVINDLAYSGEALKQVGPRIKVSRVKFQLNEAEDFLKNVPYAKIIKQ